MLIKECSLIINRVLEVEHSNGWAGFIINLRLRKVNEKVKAWLATYETDWKRKEKDLLSKLEFFYSKVERDELSTLEKDARLAIKGTLNL